MEQTGIKMRLRFSKGSDALLLLEVEAMKRIVLIALTVVFLACTLLAGCSSKSAAPNEEGDYYSQAEMAGEAPAYDEDTGKDGTATNESGGAGSSIDYENSILQPDVARKIVYTGNIQAQTTNFDEDYNAILAKLNEFGGYVQSSSVSGTKPEQWQDSGRNAQITLRVPSGKFDEFMKFLGNMGETLSSSVSGQDISLQYFDIETRLETLRTREDRLQVLLEQAATMEDIIELEQALSDVSYEIQSLEMNLRDYDSLIDFSTVTIYLTEVNVIDRVTPGEKTLGERISSGFYSVLNFLADFGEGLLVFLIAGSPILIPLGLIIWLIIWLVRRSKRNRVQKAVEYAGGPVAGAAYYDPKTGRPVHDPRGTMPNTAPKEEKQNDYPKEK